MTTITQTNRELLETMNGCEVMSVWNYETCVLVKGDQVISEGKAIDTLNTNAKIKALWDEYFEGEGGDALFY